MNKKFWMTFVVLAMSCSCSLDKATTYECQGSVKLNKINGVVTSVSLELPGFCGSQEILMVNKKQVIETEKMLQSLIKDLEYAKEQMSSDIAPEQKNKERINSLQKLGV